MAKIRTSYVANSSSSSFIVIGNTGTYNNLKIDNGILVVDGKFGNSEFGWEIEDYYDIYSRIIFVYLQALAINKQEWIDMIEKVIKDNSSVTEIIWNITDEYSDKEKTWGYIDHQSSSVEGENIEMFNSYESLRSFIFDTGSYIHTDNDNH